MVLKVVTKFISPSTVWIQAKVYDPETDELIDPTTSIKLTVQDHDGNVVVDAQDMPKDEVGVYDYYYNIAADPVEGWYPGQVVTVDGSGEGAKTSVVPFGFEVERGIV